jgi:hypothetical protein
VTDHSGGAMMLLIEMGVIKCKRRRDEVKRGMKNKTPEAAKTLLGVPG